ncbi:MAG TPA: sulfite exporter TauE/SafE family protein [Gammaproteobacteria bacterium]|nr:sulfite exporter TauE/SafE family protein [Gammaproteobacteria bacterium]
MTLLLLYALVGVAAGFFGGLFGLGGGIVVVPALYFLFKAAAFHPEVMMNMSVGTSLATAVFTATTSTWAHHRRGAVQWPVVRRLAPGVLAGGLLGAFVAGGIPANGLRVFFGLFEIAVAWQLLRNWRPKSGRGLPSTAVMIAVGGVFGALSALLGIGGGTLTVPFLFWCNIGMRESVATSAAVGLPITLAGAVGHVLAGWGQSGLPPGSTGHLYWPALAAIAATSIFAAPLGAKLAHALPVDTLKRAFAVVVAVVGVRMLWG